MLRSTVFSPLANTISCTFISFSFSAGHVFMLVSGFAPRSHSGTCCPLSLSVCVVTAGSPALVHPRKGQRMHSCDLKACSKRQHVSLVLLVALPTARGPQMPLTLGSQRREGGFCASHRPHCRPRQLAFLAVMNAFPTLRLMYFFCCEMPIHLIAQFSIGSVVFCIELLVLNIY